MKVLYATSNPNKIVSANRNLSPFDIEVKGVEVTNIQEIQTDNIQDKSVYKARQAYKQVLRPLFVSDSGWNIPALSGFPGPMMSYINRWFDSKDFLNLMRNKRDRSIILIECITYINADTLKVFKHEIKGEFLESEDGEGTSLDKIITFREDKKSVARCQNEKILSIDQVEMWNEFGNYLRKNQQ